MFFFIVEMAFVTEQLGKLRMILNGGSILKGFWPLLQRKMIPLTLGRLIKYVLRWVEKKRKKKSLWIPRLLFPLITTKKTSKISSLDKFVSPFIELTYQNNQLLIFLKIKIVFYYYFFFFFLIFLLNLTIKNYFLTIFFLSFLSWTMIMQLTMSLLVIFRPKW